MAQQFPMPFGGIKHKVTLDSFEAGAVIQYIIDEQDGGHYHNFAVQIDHPGGIVIYGSALLMECIQKFLGALRG